MTAAAWRRAKLPPLAAALAIACLALLAWTAAARADGEIAVPPLGTSGGETSTVPDTGSAPGPSGGATDPGDGTGTGGATQEPPAAAEPPPSSDTVTPQQQPSDPPVDRGDPVPPPVDGIDWGEDRTSGGTSDTPASHESGSKGGGSSNSSTAAVVPLGTAVQDPSGLTPEGDLSLPPMTQFTVVPESASTGGSVADAGLPSGGVRIGCLTLCPGGTKLAAMRLALSREARSAVREARARANGTAAKVTALSPFGLAGQGGAGLFNLLLGGGGSGAAVVFIGFLAVLMGLVALPRDRSMRFRLPAVSWRPSAYVSPLELPG